MNGYPSFYPKIALVAPSPGRRQAIIWTNAGILLIWPLGTNFNEILIEIHTFSFKKMRLKCRPFCLGLSMLRGLVMLYDVDPGCLWMTPEPIISKVHRWPWSFSLVIIYLTMHLKITWAVYTHSKQSCIFWSESLLPGVSEWSFQNVHHLL